MWNKKFILGFLYFYRTSNRHSLARMLLIDIMKIFNACDECWAVNSEIGNVFKGYSYKKEKSKLVV